MAFLYRISSCHVRRSPAQLPVLVRLFRFRPLLLDVSVSVGGEERVGNLIKARLGVSGWAGELLAWFTCTTR